MTASNSAAGAGRLRSGRSPLTGSGWTLPGPTARPR